MTKSIFEASDMLRTEKTGRWLTLLTVCLLFFMGQVSFAQASLYVFSQTSETYAPITGTTVVFDGTTTSQDDGWRNNVDIGFTFNLGGVDYTAFNVTANGLIKLGTEGIGGSNWTNVLGNTATHRPLIAAFWDDNNLDTGSIVYSTTGTAPNRVLSINFQNTKIGGGGSTGGAAVSYLVRLYETTNIIEMVYSSPFTTANTVSASVGINDMTSFLSITPGTTFTSSSTTPNNSIAATAMANLAGKKLTFTPPVACTGTPNAGTISGALVRPTCGGSTPSPSTATVTGYTIGAIGISLQWERSIDNENWSNATGTGNATATYTLPSHTAGQIEYYRLKITCSNSGLSSYSDTVQVTDPAAPTTQATNVTTSSLLNDRATITWTNGSGTRRFVKINTTNSFTDPVDGSGAALTASTVYSGSAEQIVFDGTGSSVTVTGLTANTTYYVRVYEYLRCGSSAPFTYYYQTSTGTNNPTSITTDLYCTSVPTSLDYSGITGVSLAGVSFPVGVVTYYKYPTTIDIQAGVTNTSSVNFATGYSYDTNIWIDLNNNGTFEENELVFQGNSVQTSTISGVPTTLNTSFPLDALANLGQHRMRIGTADTNQAIPNPCYSGSYGITIDLTVNVLAAPSCIPPANLSISPTSLTGLNGSWTGDAESYQIAINTSPTPPESGTGPLYGNTASAGNLTTGQTYYLHVRSICGGDFSSWVTSSPLVLDYCTPTGTSNSYRINGVSTTGGETNISNLSNGTTNAYSNFSAMNVSKWVGEQVTFSINVPSSTSVRVYIDWNNNGIFDSNELITTTSYNSSTGNVTAAIAVPEGTPVGNYRVRLRSNWYGYSAPACGGADYGYGEAEDYTFSVIAPPSCMAPTNLALVGTDGFSGQFSWTAAIGDNIQEYEWIVVADGAGSGATPIASGSTTSTSLTASGLSPVTAYDFYVRTDCGSEDGTSVWSSKIDFTTTVACPAPTALQTTMVFGTQAAFTWTSLGTDFIVEWGTTGFTLGTGTTANVSGNTYSLSNLTPDTTYQLYVRQNCGVNGTSTNAGPISFTPSYTATYTAGNIPTQFGLTNPACQPEATLVIVVPEGKQIASLTVEYSMTSQNTAWTEEQNSMIYSPTLGLGEAQIVQGTGGSTGTINYNRTLTFANGATGTVNFVMRVWRLWGDTAPNTGCNTYYAFVANNSWKLIPVFEDIPQCIAPTGLITSNPTVSSISLNWNASASETIEGYNWFVFEAGSNPDTATPVASGTTTGTNATATGLTSSTAYDAYVKTNCGSEDGESPFSAIASFTTRPGCGDMFYDNGGPSGNYTNGANVTDTFFPDNEGGIVAVVFSSFVTSSGDNLTVYDGPDATAPLLGTYSGSQLGNGSAFISTHPTGALTFVFVSDGFGNSAGWAAQIICLCEGVWAGGESTDWNNPANWCGNTLPDDLTEVIVISSNPAVINSAVEIGSITLSANASVTVNGSLTVEDITVQTGGSLVIANNATLWQTPNANNSGNVTVQKTVAMKHLDYTIWSSPVTGQGLKQFSPLTLDNRIRDYASNGWAAVSNVNAAFTSGKGYMFRAPNANDGSYTGTYNWTGSFVGTPNNQDRTVTFTTASSHQSIGNPYPTSISAQAFYDQNDANLGAMYFWCTDRSEANRNNSSVSAWAVWTSGVGGVHPAGGTFGTEEDMTISAGQGFLIGSTGVNSVEFTTDMRVNGTATFYRTMPSEKHRLWLNLSNTEAVLNQTLVAYVEGATQALDSRIDGELFEKTSSALYSLIENQTANYVIQGRALPFNDLDVVPMGFRAAEAGSFTISLANFDGLFTQGQDIFLKDKLTQTVHNLKEGSYTFVSEEGTFNTRFDVVYRENALNVSNPDLNNKWVVYPKDGQFQIESQGFDMKEVVVYDMLGRTVYQNNAEGSNHTISRISGNQVLIVKVITTENAILTKKVNN